MQKQKIIEIQRLAHCIDPRINLFEGYEPKNTDSYKGELLFWRQIVTLYGLFADCARVQIKEKKNLLELMRRYALIERADYDMAFKFWNDISEVRKWFCHNNDLSLYYANNRQIKLKRYLNTAFILATNKPEQIEDIQSKDWDILTYDLDRRFCTYLDVLIKGLCAWKTSPDFEDVLAEWITLLANSLFADKELIHNILIEIAVYNKLNYCINNISATQLANEYYKQLESNCFSAQHIENELRRVANRQRSNKEIVEECIRNNRLI